MAKDHRGLQIDQDIRRVFSYGRLYVEMRSHLRIKIGLSSKDAVDPVPDDDEMKCLEGYFEFRVGSVRPPLPRHAEVCRRAQPLSRLNPFGALRGLDSGFRAAAYRIGMAGTEEWHPAEQRNATLFAGRKRGRSTRSKFERGGYHRHCRRRRDVFQLIFQRGTQAQPSTAPTGRNGIETGAVGRAGSRPGPARPLGRDHRRRARKPSGSVHSPRSQIGRCQRYGPRQRRRGCLRLVRGRKRYRPYRARDLPRRGSPERLSHTPFQPRSATAGHI